MENSVHVNSSSTPRNPTAPPPICTKSDENDLNYPPSIANSNPSKLGETGNVVKKKVLTDRNEANGNSDLANVDLKSTSCIEDSPYDPLTNYLSPRPRFLRFKPNRRWEILRRVGGEASVIGVGEDSLSVSQSSSSEDEEEEETEMKEEKVEGESEGKSSEIDGVIEDEDEEEGDVNRGGTVKDSLKLLLVIASLVLCTAYITSMNTPTPLFEVSRAFGSGFRPILNNTGESGLSLVAESINESGSHFWDEEITEAASNNNADEGASQFDHHEDERNISFSMEETEILNGDDRNIGFSLKEIEILNGDDEAKAVYGDLVKLEYTEAEEMAQGTIGVEKVEDEESEVEFSELIAKDEINIGFIMEETEILNDENEGKAAYGDLVKLEYTEAEEMAGGTIDEEKVEGEEIGVEFSELTAKDDGDDQPNRKKIEISNTIGEDDEDHQDKPIVALKPPLLTVAGNEYTSQMEVVEKEEAEDCEMIEGNTEEPESSLLEASKITILERITDDLFSFVEDLKKLKSMLMELMHTETESVLKAVLGLSVSSAILTCLLLSFQFKKKKDYKKEPVISVSAEPLLQSQVAKAEKVMTKEVPSTKLTSDVDRSNNEPIRNMDPPKMLSSSIHSRDQVESFKVTYHHEAPTVQFLSEFAVNDINNSLKNKSGFKNMTVEEAEDSNFPVSFEEKPVSKHVNSEPEQATSEFSTTTSPSYGSFTAKKRIAKKEVGGDGVVKSIPTPVRRSTRIRNRIVSP